MTLREFADQAKEIVGEGPFVAATVRLNWNSEIEWGVVLLGSSRIETHSPENTLEALRLSVSEEKGPTAEEIEVG